MDLVGYVSSYLNQVWFRFSSYFIAQYLKNRVCTFLKYIRILVVYVVDKISWAPALISYDWSKITLET